MTTWLNVHGTYLLLFIWLVCRFCLKAKKNCTEPTITTTTSRNRHNILKQHNTGANWFSFYALFCISLEMDRLCKQSIKRSWMWKRANIINLSLNTGHKTGWNSFHEKNEATTNSKINKTKKKRLLLTRLVIIRWYYYNRGHSLFLFHCLFSLFVRSVAPFLPFKLGKPLHLISFCFLFVVVIDHDYPMQQCIILDDSFHWYLRKRILIL